MNFITITAFLSGIISTWVLKIYKLFVISIRIEHSISNKIYDGIKERTKFKFFLTRSINNNPDSLPQIEESLRLCNGIPIFMTIDEQNLQAGFNAKEHVLVISTFRLFHGSLNRILDTIRKEKSTTDRVSIFIGTPWFIFSNKLPRKELAMDDLALDEEIKQMLRENIKAFANGEREKLGLILHGPPGNGKTSLVRAIAKEFAWDVYIPILSPNMANNEIISQFAGIPNDKSTIVVWEDFDNIFNKREPSYKDCKFSLDVFLNLIDGLYIDTKRMLFIMTANNIDKIDVALKHRPSRFDIITKLDNPHYQNRLFLLRKSGLNGQAERIAELTDGCSSAIICEIGKRKFINNMDQEVKKIIESFSSEQASYGFNVPVITATPISQLNQELHPTATINGQVVSN